MTLAEELEALLPPGMDKRYGDLVLRHCETAGFSARHIRNTESDDGLDQIDSIEDLRELAKYTAEGEYRPLKTSPTLRCGWITRTDCPSEFLKRLDAIYPGVFATWIAYSKGELDPVPLRDTLERQTGMYRFAGAIDDQMANRIMRELCSPGCIRKIAWPIDSRCAVSRLKSGKRSIPVICTEACTFAVSEARRLAREAYDRENAPA